MKLWLDDKRTPPDKYDCWIKNADDCIRILLNIPVTEISLDHDLGESGGTGYTVAMWIEEAAYSNKLPQLKWHVHSQNPVGKKKITDALHNADKYWKQHNG